MTTNRQLKLGAFMRPASIHTGAWRYPGAYPDANFNFAHLKRLRRRWSGRASTPFLWRIIYFDPARMHELKHVGEHLSVHGPSTLRNLCRAGQ